MRELIRTTLIRALAVVAAAQVVSAWQLSERGRGVGSAPHTWSVSTSDALREALSQARGGDTIQLTTGVTFVGPFQLPKHDGDDWVTVRTSGTLPERRLADSDRAHLAMLVSKVAGQPAITTAPGAHHWKLIGLDVSQVGGNTYGVIRCGSADGYSSLDQVPHHIEFDRIYVHVDGDAQERRGIQANCADMAVRRSVIRGMKEEGADSQAVAGWDGTARLRIEDNLVEAASEPILIGGERSSQLTPVPEDITITGNTIRKPLEWRGKPWNLKNLLELKNARRVRIVGNILENNWPAAQTGWAVLFTARGGRSYPWAVLEDVTFEHNLVRNVSSGINMLGLDDEGGSRTLGRRFNVRGNLIVTNSKALGGDGWCYMVLGGAHDVSIDHNTCIQDGTLVLMVEKGPAAIPGFRYTDNIAWHGKYGIVGSGQAPGVPTIRQFFQMPVVERNVFGDCGGVPYPATNLCPSRSGFLDQFVDPSTGDYSLKASTPWRRAGLDGTDLGADISSLPR